MNFEKQIAEVVAKDALLRVIQELPEGAEFAFVSFQNNEDGLEMSRIRYSSTISNTKLHFAGSWIAKYGMDQYAGSDDDEGETA